MFNAGGAVFCWRVRRSRVVAVFVLFPQLVLMCESRERGNKLLSALFVMLNTMQQGEKDKCNHPQTQDPLTPAFCLTGKEV
jgi:hypothetical protein